MTISRDEAVAINKAGWNQVASRFFGFTALPQYGPLTPTEDELHLIEDLNGAAVLELGCGSGHSLKYLAEQRGAGELWGLDLADQQITYAREVLSSQSARVQLFVGSMDEDPGIPKGHFDLVVALYALGWTPDLDRTVSLVHSYLKPGGRFVFSWEHPVFSCLDYDQGANHFFLWRSYLQEGRDAQPWRGSSVVFHRRKLSTFINALTGAGLVVDRLIESDPPASMKTPKNSDPSKQWYAFPRAEMVPTSFIIQSHKAARAGA